MTAASSLQAAGTSCSWSSWATRASDQPPPVSAQNPVCSPGLRWPADQSFTVIGPPGGTGRHGGSMPRTRQCSTASTTTLRPSSASPTTSCPGTNGKLTIGSNHLDDRPSTVARSLPQMPASRGRTTCHPAPGGAGGSTSTSRSGPARPPPPGFHPDATRAAAKRATDRSTCRAFMSGGSGPAPSAGVPSAAGGAVPRGRGANARRASLACGRWPPAWFPG